MFEDQNDKVVVPDPIESHRGYKPKYTKVDITKNDHIGECVSVGNLI